MGRADDGTSTPWGSPADFFHVGQFCLASLVTEGHEDGAMVGEGRDHVQNRDFLATCKGASRDKDASIFAVKRAFVPERASGIPEGLHLHGHVTKSGGNSEEEPVEVGEIVGLNEGVVRLGGCLDQGENLFSKCLCTLVYGGIAASLDDAFLDGLGQLGYVAIYGINDDGDSGAAGHLDWDGFQRFVLLFSRDGNVQGFIYLSLRTVV